LLAIDTSGRQGSIALARGGPGEACELIEASSLMGGTFSAHLIPQIADLLKNHGFTPSDIGGFVVVAGPGSFTGLRVGLAAIKALAEVLEKPIAGVSLLEALAISTNLLGRVTTVIDAWRGDVYLGEYELSDTGTQVIVEHLVTREACFASVGNTTIVTPDQEIAEAARSKGLHFIQVEHGPIAAIAQSGWKKIVSGQTVSAEALEASYFQRSDAELFAKSGS